VFYSLVWSRRLYDIPFYSPRECPNRDVLDCADASVVRTPSRQELLYARSKIAVTARAFGLEAIDMVGEIFTLSISSLTKLPQVCVKYDDLGYLRDECADGRRLGFSGKVSTLCLTRLGR
jgi:citrate lyase beta subunit